MLDDRPQFTLHLSMAEALTVKDALTLTNFLIEGDMDAVVAFMAASDSRYEIDDRDRLRARIHELTLPVIRAEASNIRARIEAHRAEYEREIQRDLEDD